MIENAVTIEEVAKVTRSTAEKVAQEAQALNLFVGRDWADRPCMNEWDASQLVSGLARQQADGDRAWSDHRAATEQWEAERERVYMDAQRAVMDAHGGDPLPMLRPGANLTQGPREVQREAQAAGDRAVAAWERRHPVPTIQGQRTATSWRRLVDALTGADR